MTPKRPNSPALLAAATIAFFASCGPSLGAEYGLRNDNTGCIADLHRSRKNKGWLAIAITRTVGIAQGCGIASAAVSPRSAREGALQGCRVNIKYPIFEGNTACRVTGVEKRK